ncbi:MAG: hypothetical protein WD011_05690 [Nitriliruptoraceae bacterium]
MPETMDAEQLQRQLEDVLARAASGEYIVVRSADGREVAIGPRRGARRSGASPVRRRHPSDRTVADVLAEDRGA